VENSEDTYETADGPDSWNPSEAGRQICTETNRLRLTPEVSLNSGVPSLLA
jgi:hypothetical protein